MNNVSWTTDFIRGTLECCLAATGTDVISYTEAMSVLVCTKEQHCIVASPHCIWLSTLYSDFPTLYSGFPTLYSGFPTLYSGFPTLYSGFPTLYSGFPTLYNGFLSSVRVTNLRAHRDSLSFSQHLLLLPTP